MVLPLQTQEKAKVTFKCNCQERCLRCTVKCTRNLQAAHDTLWGRDGGEVGVKLGPWYARVWNENRMDVLAVADEEETPS